MSIQEIIDAGRRRAEQLLGRVIEWGLEYSPALSNLKGVLEQTAEAEAELRDLAGRIRALETVGYATSADFNGYNTVLRNIQVVQRKLLAAVRRVFGDRPDVLSRLPIRVTEAPPLTPLMARLSEAGWDAWYPKTPVLPTSASGQDSSAVGVSGLGNLGTPAAAAAPAAGAAALSPWMICAIILAAIVAMGVVAALAVSTLGVSVESISAILLVREQIKGLRATIDARMEVYNSCVAGGGTPADCSRLAISTIPTPREAAAEYPQFGGWIKWVGITIIGAGVLGLGYWLLRERLKSRQAPRLQGVNPRYRPVRAGRFPSEPAEDQGLPV